MDAAVTVDYNFDWPAKELDNFENEGEEYTLSRKSTDPRQGI